MAKEKAWVGFILNNRNGMRKELGGKTRKNLGSIHETKERIKHLEVQNEELAVENESLKTGAADSIELINNARDLQQQIELMSADLGDKALEIRKLIEANKALTA